MNGVVDHALVKVRGRIMMFAAYRRLSLGTVSGVVGCLGHPEALPVDTEQGGVTAVDVGSDDGMTSSAPVKECGNGVVEDEEECDGASLGGATCESLGHPRGSLRCTETCSFDVSGCIAPKEECGNGIAEEGEECDGMDVRGMSCESLYGEGSVGELECAKNCAYEVGSCIPASMVLVPGGEFTMGSEERANELPIRQVQIDAFWMDRTEVTVGAYAECVDDGTCSLPGGERDCNWNVVGRENHPVNCVDWFQAETYCSWVDGGTKRLLTEAEWEKAARWTDARRYPWGDEPEPSCSHVVMDDADVGGDGCGMHSTMEVGSKSMGASPYGVHDMAGNVWEWVSDWYGSYDAGETDNPTGPADGTQRVMRGGSWDYHNPNDLRAAYRGLNISSFSFNNVGFRCGRDSVKSRQSSG